MSQYRPKSVVVEAVKLTNDVRFGDVPVNKGDYLVTDNEGNQFFVSEKALNASFEPADAPSFALSPKWFSFFDGKVMFTDDGKNWVEAKK